MEGKTYAWGEESPNAGEPHANLWQGMFPYYNAATDGYEATGPVHAPNGHGLYDMAGNVWEWTQDWYRPDTYAQRVGDTVTVNPQGPDSSYDPREPTIPKRVMRGGSHLCSEHHCTGYRPSARSKASPDTGLSHTGFRCVMTPDMAAQTAAHTVPDQMLPTAVPQH